MAHSDKLKDKILKRKSKAAKSPSLMERLRDKMLGTEMTDEQAYETRKRGGILGDDKKRQASIDHENKLKEAKRKRRKKRRGDDSMDLSGLDK